MARAFLVVFAALASSCAFDAAVPAHARVVCATAADCSGDFVCLHASGSIGTCTAPGGACLVAGSSPREVTSQPDGNACALASGSGICVDGACTRARCGDGVVTASLHETCDGTDGCRADCTRCGDGVRDPGEACDDGAANSDTAPGACRLSCVEAGCGDGVRDPGEVCDDGAGNSDTAPDACRTACEPASCGDGVVDTGEICDSTAGCRSDCSKVNVCGDGVTDPNEECDDANTNPFDGCDACHTQQWTSALVVSGRIDGTAIEVGLADPQGLTVDLLGRVIVADSSHERIRRIELDGTMTTIAGTGAFGDAGDGGPATSAAFRGPASVAADAFGRVLVVDSSRVRRINADGTIESIAGTVFAGFAGDGGPATLAMLNSPSAIALDESGRVFIADRLNERVRRIDVDGTIATVAGTGTAGFSGDGGLATNAQLSSPIGVAVDASGRIYISDNDNRRIRRVDENGTIITFAGTGADDFGIDGGDGGPAILAAITDPFGLAFDAAGALYVADPQDERVRRIDVDGTIDTVAGNGIFGSSGDGGPATLAGLARAQDVAVAPDGAVYIADTVGNAIRRVVDGTIETVSGAGDAGFAGDGGPATSAVFFFPMSVVVDDAGRVLIVDQSHDSIRMVQGGIISTIAGGVRAGFGGDGGPALGALMFGPSSIAPDGNGGFIVADTRTNRIRRIDAAGIISTVAGSSSVGFVGDGGPATSAALNAPTSAVVDALGRIVIADTQNHRVRRVELDGTIVTIAGDGVASFGGDGGDATLAHLDTPNGVAVDAVGHVFIADTDNQRVRRIELDGTITTFAGSGVADIGGDGGPAVAAALARPAAVCVDDVGRLLIADSFNGRVRRVALDGTIATVAGTGNGTSGGDGGPATQASLLLPMGVFVDAGGRIFIADTFNQSVRIVDVDGTITTLAGALDPLGPGPLARAQLYPPAAAALVGTSLFSVGGAGRVLDVDLATSTLAVVAGYDFASPAVQGQARFASPLDPDTAGVAFDPVALTLVVTEPGPATGGLRVIALDPDGDGVVDAPSLWTDARIDVDLGGAAGIAYDASTDTFVVVERIASCVARVDRTGRVLGIVTGDCGDPGVFPGHLDAPSAVAVTGAGVIYVSDTGNNRVLRVDVDGTAALVIGDGSASSAGDGAPARHFPVRAPGQLGLDAFGNLYVASSTTVREIENVDGNADADGDDRVITIYGGGDRASFPESASLCMSALVVDPAGMVYAADACQGFLVALTSASAP